MISIHTLKICGEPIRKPMEYIFRISSSKSLPFEWKKANVVSIRKKKW